MVVNDTENSEKCQYARSLYNNFSEVKKDKRQEYGNEKYKTFPKKKKRKIVNMLANDIEIFLKSSNFL